jgi:D-serine deaminase-like pyridoxal phosphate-dependent protein
MDISKKLNRPIILLNQKTVLNNIEKMVTKANKSNIKIRPHFKTHQSAQIGEWFKDFGIDSITVSSVAMAEYFANNGWKDISIAFPVNIREMNNINKLAKKVQLHLLVESSETINYLNKRLNNPVHVWIKIDAGYHRTGVLWNKRKTLFELVSEIQNCNQMKFKGLLSHSGNTYNANSRQKILQIYEETVSRLKKAQNNLLNAGFQKTEISIGDTPSCSLAKDFSAVNEIRPGNFIFYDVTQLNLGVCSEKQVAVGVACPVVAKHKDRKEIVIYGGAVHLSKEFFTDKTGIKIFGLVAQLTKDGWSQTLKKSYVAGLSQEHGKIKTTNKYLNQINVGDILIVLPVHSCLTVNLLKKYITLAGEEIITM